MNDKTKKTLIIVGSVSALCILACVALFIVGNSMFKRVGKMFQTDPAKVAQAAHTIVDYDLPPGYSERMSMDFISYRVAMIGPTDENSSMMIMLGQFTNSTLNPDQMAEQIRKAFEQQGAQPGLSMRTVETRTMTIRGTQTDVTIREGTSSAGFTFRQLITVFPGKGGPAVLMIQGTTADWDEKLVDAFIQSIR